MDQMAAKKAILACAVGAGFIGALVILFPSNKTKPAPVAPATAAAPLVIESNGAVVPPALASVKTPDLEKEIKELRYLPEKVAVPDRGDSPLFKQPNMLSSARRVSNVRALTNKQKDGDFLNPRWSPDGLQMIVSRQGYAGIYVMDARTGAWRRIADGNSFRAKWTPDGLIEVVGEDGLLRHYDADGTLIATLPDVPRTGPVYAEDDAIYIRKEDGSTVPLTSNDDRYFNPVLSPDGKSVVFQGLLSGLYMAPVDGSSEPVYLGTGNNPVWMPDSGGLLFDVTADDGHHLTEGDIYFVDRGQTERTNLTPGDTLVTQMPSVDPTGGQVAFESEGTIYVGEVR